MLKIFIERPILSSVISIILVLMGLIGLNTLPVEQYPDIAPPVIRVAASYTGADAETVLKSVVMPLEEQINGVENMIYMSSTAGNDGMAAIEVYFSQGTDPDMAAVNVQNRVARSLNLLPAEVTRAGVTTAKGQNRWLMIFSLYGDSGQYDETFLQNYSKINLLPRIQRVIGVGDVMVFGARDYSMRIWLKPDVMAAYGLVPVDIAGALNDQNLEAAPGRLGQQNEQSFEYVLRYKGKYTEPSEFENIVIKADLNGNILRLKDVARVELGSLSYSGTTATMNRPGIAMAVFQSPDSNARDVINQAQRVLDETATTFPPGMRYHMITNANDFLNSSIEKVVSTFLEAFLLVFLVVFLFLQDFRATLIPAIAVPVSIIGTFFFLSIFGFTVNLLTLFALVLAIGIVVDDAIVVVEAIHAKMEQGVRNAKEAAAAAMHEISAAIVSITLVMSAVFLPVSFITGTTGVFYRQFGITLAVAIVISAINALTLSPALCALLLRTGDDSEGNKLSARFKAAFNTAFATFTTRYRRAAGVVIHRKWIAVLLIVVFTITLGILLKTTPKGFVPEEDVGLIMLDISLPPATSLEETLVTAGKVDSIIANTPEIEGRSMISGRSIISGAGSSYAMLFCDLKPLSERSGKGQDIASVINKLYGAVSEIKEARILIFRPPQVPGFSFSGGFEVKLEDITGGDIQRFEQIADQFMEALNRRPEIGYAATSFNSNFPQYVIDVDAARCEQAGVKKSAVLAALQGYIGGYYASDFNRFGKQYRVMIQSEPEFRGDKDDLNNIFVRTASGRMAPVTGFITMTKAYGPENITRFNMFTSIGVNGSPGPGFSTGDAITAVRETATETLPPGYGFEFSGLTREEIASSGQAIWIFLLSVVFVYFLLCAQYESFFLPLSILLPMPIGIAGAFIFARIMGVENNIYLQLSLIMLIGLLAKNAILIVEFALQRQRAGMDIVQSALEGATARLRPIMMTSFAIIIGMLPLVISGGIGANGNRSIGVGAVGGMFIGTMFGILVIPAMYVVFRTIDEKIRRRRR